MTKALKISGPYHGILRETVDAIVTSLREIYAECSTVQDVHDYPNGRINKNFNFLSLHYSKSLREKDPHLLRPMKRVRKTLRKSANNSHQMGRTRISDLIKDRVLYFAREHGLRPETGHFYYPHPLKITLDYLTLPEEDPSSEYGFYSIRNYIFEEHNCWPEKYIDNLKNVDTESVLSFMDVSDALKTALTHKRHYNDAFNPTSTASTSAIYSLLCVEELLQVRTRKSKTRSPLSLLLEHFDNWSIFPAQKNEKKTQHVNIEFMVSKKVDRMPGISHICNRLWGIPLAFRGGSTVFSGGLQLSNQGGLVIGSSGDPGTGKTSMALSLGAYLAPYGTTTIYITAEEEPGDLKARLNSLIPAYFRKTSFFDDNLDSWFIPKKLPSHTQGKSGKKQLRKIIDEISDIRQKSLSDYDDGSKETLRIKPFAPLLIILDGVQAYFDNLIENNNSENFYIQTLVEECRKLNTVVLLTSSTNKADLGPIDYLVDVVVKLIYSDTDVATSKPYRTFSLEKTRHQVSRPGAHLLHLTGKKGFRISPQLTSQIDSRTVFRQQLPDAKTKSGNGFYQVLNTWKDKTEKQLFLNTFPRSHVLLHGTGSTGKAGLGLKLLSAPLVESRPLKDDESILDGFTTQNDDELIDLVQDYKPRIYVLSFLYGEAYYKNLLSGVERTYKKELKKYHSYSPNWYKKSKPEITVNHCYPGFLKPEDLYAKINDELNRAENEGLPYNGILLDGLHNVFMQFPLLETSETIWPMLYSMFRTRNNLNVLTTHTTISLGSVSTEDSFKYRLKQDMPFLLALVQSSDFYLELNEVNIRHKKLYPNLALKLASNSENKEAYILQARSSIGQDVPISSLLWDKNSFSFTYTGLPEGDKLMNKLSDEQLVLFEELMKISNQNS